MSGVSNQQKWDSVEAERSGVGRRSGELPFPFRADLPSEKTLELLAPGEFRREMVAIADDGDTWDITENVDAALKTVTVVPPG